jgi:hypothetical protein
MILFVDKTPLVANTLPGGDCFFLFYEIILVSLYDKAPKIKGQQKAFFLIVLRP